MSDAKAQLAAQYAVRDPVTGLPNRVLFLNQLERALAAVAGSTSSSSTSTGSSRSTTRSATPSATTC
jgi:GGDEF domain-containing protein